MSEGKDQPIPIYLNMKMKSTRLVWRPKSTESDSKKIGTAVAGTASPPSSSLADNNNQSKRISVDTSISDDCSGKCSVSLEVGASLIRYVKGKGGSTQQQIEEETGTKILFPSRWNDNHIVIEGTTNESITKASEKIATVVEEKISSEVHEALDNRPVFVRLQGLECMQGSPAKARVVYAPVEEVGAEGRLLNACKVITKAYIEAGLVLQKDAHHTLKLHATIINAGQGKSNLRSYNRKKGDTFDAQNIFSKYGSENWGECIIREAHLSERFKYDENGYYHCCASLPFPDSVQVE